MIGLHTRRFHEYVPREISLLVGTINWRHGGNPRRIHLLEARGDDWRKSSLNGMDVLKQAHRTTEKKLDKSQNKNTKYDNLFKREETRRNK